MLPTMSITHPQAPIRSLLSPSKVRFNLSQTTPCASVPADHSDCNSISSMSDEDDDDDRVFFGSPKKGEEELVAKLSKAVPATPRSKLRKRDSREFMRRKTMLVTPPRRNHIAREDPQPETVSEIEEERTGREGSQLWPGGFYERRDTARHSDCGSSPSSSITSPAPTLYPETQGARTTESEDHCNLTLDFSRFRVSDSPLSNTRPTSIRRPSLLSGSSRVADLDAKSDADATFSEVSDDEEDEAWSGSEGDDSDKENAPAPVEYAGDSEEEKADYPLFDGPLTGSRSHAPDSGDEEGPLGSCIVAYKLTA
jgi:hypothetical protein